MSLLEDVFLENEAGEAQELERVIEGDDFDVRPRSDSDENSEKEDEAAEDKRRVDPNSTKTRVVKNPRFVLNPARLTGPRGIQILPEHFKDFKFKGKGHEQEDLDLVLKKLEHWAYRLYPKFAFEDCLKKIETLGKKRPVMVHLQKIRSDQILSEETVVQNDSSDEEVPGAEQQRDEPDEFDKLLQQQIELARMTPAPGSGRKVHGDDDRSPFSMPKATSSPSISDEQKERMIKNRKLAEERRLARLTQINLNNPISETSHNVVDLTKQVIEEGVEEVSEISITKKHSRSNVIDSDSSDNDCEVTATNDPITVDVHVHNTRNQEKGNDAENSDTPVDITEEAIRESTEEARKTPTKYENNKSYVIDSDSSDNACEVTAVNDSIVVDVHAHKAQHEEKSDNLEKNDHANDSMKNIDELKNLTNNDNNDTTISVGYKKQSHIETVIANDIEMTEGTEKHDVENDDNVSNIIDDGSKKEYICADTFVNENLGNHENAIKEDNLNEIKSPEHNSKSVNTVAVELSNKENLDSNVRIEEELTGVMDVDFSDDF